MEGRNDPFRSARDPGMTSVHPQRRAPLRAVNKRKREFSANAYLFRGPSERSFSSRSRRPPTAVTSASGTAVRPASRSSQTPAPKRPCRPRRRPRSRRLERRRNRRRVEPPARMTVSAAGRLRRLADQDLSRMLEAARGSRATPILTSRRCASPINPDGSLSKRRSSSTRRQTRRSNRRPRASWPRCRACNPLPVPAQYRPFYEQWKTKTIHFDPQVAAR